MGRSSEESGGGAGRSTERRSIRVGLVGESGHTAEAGRFFATVGIWCP